MSGDPWELRVAGSADRALAKMSEKSAAAIVEFMYGPLRENPQRLGKPLRGEQTGRWAARRGPYRIIYELDDGARIIRVLHADHRADVYRPR